MAKRRLLLRSGRSDVRALDQMFMVFDTVSWQATCRVIRFFCAARGIKAIHIWTPDE